MLNQILPELLIRAKVCGTSYILKDTEYLMLSYLRHSAAAYGQRYGVTLADEISSGFFSNFFYPVLFKADPRYFRLGEGTIKHRIVYALFQEVDGKRDNGRRGIDWENILGAFTAGGLSNVYYPPAERGVTLTMSRSAISIGYGSLGGVIDEFYPDISHWLSHRRHKTVAQHQ